MGGGSRGWHGVGKRKRGREWQCGEGGAVGAGGVLCKFLLGGGGLGADGGREEYPVGMGV